MKSSSSIITLSVLTALTCGHASAEFIGFSIKAAKGLPALSGSLNNRGPSIELVDDLGAVGSRNPSMMLILEHPIAALPNIKYSTYELGSSATYTLDNDIQFNGTSFSSGNQITSSFDIDHDNIVLYYQFLNDGLDLDLGVDLKRFAGEISVSGESSSSIEINEIVPLFYLSARFELPFNGFYLGADINTNFIDFGLSDSNIEDSTLLLGYDSGNGLGFEGGIKYYSLQLDDQDDLDTNLRYDGLFLNGYYNF